MERIVRDAGYRAQDSGWTDCMQGTRVSGSGEFPFTMHPVTPSHLHLASL
ncbi:MAG: hypothetical protein M9904_05090 [Chitinophagaceae bacterium]|nr:hypothetical protein [Chitinophagaceae bacterium]